MAISVCLYIFFFAQNRIRLKNMLFSISFKKCLLAFKYISTYIFSNRCLVCGLADGLTHVRTSIWSTVDGCKGRHAVPYGRIYATFTWPSNSLPFTRKTWSCIITTLIKGSLLRLKLRIYRRFKEPVSKPWDSINNPDETRLYFARKIVFRKENCVQFLSFLPPGVLGRFRKKD